MAFELIAPGEWQDNPFQRIGTDWMLITAGTAEKCNTMTASWGQMGILWNRPVATIYIRPSRYTKGFVEEQGRFSLSFFEPGTQREELLMLGTKSGRDLDKIAAAKLTTTLLDGVPAFEEANLVFVCRTLYIEELKEACFIDKLADTANYPEKDYHTAYTAQIEKIYRR